MSDINFSKLTWENLPARTTALSATNLNRIEKGIDDSVNGVNSNSHSIAELQTRISQMSGGVPPTASSTSGMNPEVSPIYVNTTDGNWYYYNGSAWTSGGTYGGAVTDTTLSISGMAADSKAVGEALALKADDADVTAIDERVTAVEGDVSDLETDFNDVSDNVSNLEFDVFGEHKTVFTSETWQAIAGTDVRENGHSLSVDIPANTNFTVKLVAPDGVFSANKINIYTYNENSERVNSIYNKPVNTEFTYTSAQALKRITVFISGGDVIGNGDFYLTVSFVEIKSDSLKAQVDEIASEIDAINGKFIQSKNIAENVVWILGDYTNTGDIRRDRAGYIAHETYILADSETYYTVSWERSGGEYAIFCYYDSEKTRISATGSLSMANRKITIQTPENTAYLRVCLWKSGETFENLVPTRFQIEKGRAATSYIAPNVLNSDNIDPETVYNKMAEDGLFDAKTSVPEYYHTNNYLENKLTRINALASSCAATGDSFIFITDEHWPLNQKQSIPLISAINESCHIDKVFSGGDTADGLSEDFCNQLRKAFPHRIYHVAGNHDWFTEDGNLMYYYMDAYNVDQIGNPENHYYYVDNPQKKIRYIILNRFKQVNGEWINMNNDSEQVSWLANEALNVESGWGVIVFVHYIAESESVALALDSAKNNGVDVIAIIAGHNHFDMIQHTYGGIPMIYTTCDKNEAWIHGGVNQEPWLTEDRPSGTIYEQAFDVFTVDRVNKTITIVRIGMPAMDNVDIALVSPEWTYHGTLEERVVTYT